MLSQIKRLTKHSAVYGAGHILSRSLGFLLLPIHTNVLQTPEAYRPAALLFTALAFFNVIFSYGLDVAFLRFFILEKTQKGKQRIFSTAFWMIFITGVCFACVMILFPAPFSKLIFQSEAWTHLIRLAAGILVADALCLIPFLVLRGEEKSSQFVIFKTLNIVINLGLNILLVAVLKKGVQGIFISNLLASVGTLFCMLPIIFKWLRTQFSRKTLAELMHFGLPYIPTLLSILIMGQIGRFFLDRMVGEEATGIFSANYKLGMIMALVVAAFRFAWHPFFLSTAKEENAPKTFARIFTYFVFITGFIFLGVSFFIRDLIQIEIGGVRLVGEAYGAGVSIVPLIMLSHLASGIYANFIVGVYLKKKTIYLPFITGSGAIVSVLGNYFLIPIWGLMGAAWSVFFAYVTMAYLLGVVSHRLYPIPYEIKRVLMLALVIGVLFAVGYYALQDTFILFRILLLLMVFPILWLIGFFKSDEKEMIRMQINKVFKRRIQST